MSTSSQSRPRGILKNPSTNVVPTTDPNLSTSPTDISSTSPDLTLQNTAQNAGQPRRNSSQTARSSVSRRTSSNAAATSAAREHAENEMRLKWDEKNIYLYEQEKTPKMKIDEPKTPYAKRYEPSEEDQEEMRTLDAQDLVVDELDQARQAKRGRQPKEADIPGLDIGEPEDLNTYSGHEGIGGRDDSGRVVMDQEGSGERRSESVGKGEKIVQVDEARAEEGKHDGEKRHRDFEEMRKKHYEMSGVKGMLGHTPDELMDEDDDEEPPPVPKLGGNVVNGA